MKEKNLLKQVQEHGDLAFMQGYMAAKSGITLEEKYKLSKMPEAQKRVSVFEKIFNGLQGMEVNNAD